MSKKQRLSYGIDKERLDSFHQGTLPLAHKIRFGATCRH